MSREKRPQHPQSSHQGRKSRKLVIRDDSEDEAPPPVAARILNARAQSSNAPPRRSSSHPPVSDPEITPATPLNYSTIARRISDRYITRQIIPHHFIDWTFFAKCFRQVTDKWVFQGWKPLLELEAPIYIDHVREFYSNLDFETNLETNSTTIISWVCGQALSFSPDYFCTILGIPTGGVHYSRLDFGNQDVAIEMAVLKSVYRPTTPNITSYPPAIWLTFEAKLLFFVFVKCVRPISSGFNDLTLEFCFYLSCLVENRKINLSHIIVKRMKEAKSTRTYKLPYGALLTKLFEAKRIPLFGPKSNVVALAQISEPTFKQMHIKFSGDQSILWNNRVVSAPNYGPFIVEEAPTINAPNPPLHAPVHSPDAPSSPPSGSHSWKDYLRAIFCMTARGNKRTRKNSRAIKAMQRAQQGTDAGTSAIDSVDEESEEDRKLCESFGLYEEDVGSSSHSE